MHTYPYWGEPERAPQLRNVQRFCLYVDTVQVDICVGVLYVGPYISIWSCENGHRSRTVQYSQQTASDDMVIAWNEDNLQVTPLFNAHRIPTKKIGQQPSTSEAYTFDGELPTKRLHETRPNYQRLRETI